MPYTKELPEWNAGGIKPPQSKIDAGWQVDEKPPASWWNWYMYTAYQSLLELQQNAVHGEKLGANSGVATLGSDGKLTATQLPAIGTGQITDGSITNNDLATDVKIGSLASLTTTAKGSVTAAVNDVKSIIDNHLNDTTRHITAQERIRWNGGQLFPITGSDGTPKSLVTNLNTATTVGVHTVGSNATGAPTAAVGILTVWKRGAVHLFQEYWVVNLDTIYIRSSIDNGVTWTVWQTIANTEVATTSKNGLMSSSDKTALDNAQKWKLTLDNGNSKTIATNDADNEKDGGFFATYSNTLNVPEVGGHIQVIKRDGNQSVQIFYGLANRNVYVRNWIVQNWTSWKRLTDNNLLGGVLLGNKLVDTQTANFVGKVAGSTTANPHITKRTQYGTTGIANTLLSPGSSMFIELDNNDYPKVAGLDGVITSPSNSANGNISQMIFSFDLIAHVERTYGTIPGATTADKVAWIKANISKITLNWHGYGSSPAGSKANLAAWAKSTSQWVNTVSHTSALVSKLTISIPVTGATSAFDTDGIAHFLAYAEPSNGTTASVINTDYVELQVELSTSLKDNMKPVWIDATLQNGWVVSTDTTQNPQYSIGTDGYVSLRGAIQNGTLPGVCITLPAGYRPVKSIVVPVSGSSGNLYRIIVSAGGSVTVEQSIGSGGNKLVYLDGITFPTN